MQGFEISAVMLLALFVTAEELVVFRIAQLDGAYWGWHAESEIIVLNQERHRYCTIENSCLKAPLRPVYYNAEFELYMYWRPYNSCGRFTLGDIVVSLFLCEMTLGR